MKIVFMGTPSAAVPTLKRIIEDGHEVLAVWTQPDRPSGRGNKLHISSVKEFAVANNLEVYQPTKIRTEEAAELFSSYNADVAVVVAYGRILPPAFLSQPKHGCINVHFSLLPKYRGAAPVNWAIVNGETVTGVTTMLMDEGLDTGDILLQRETEIGEGETSVDLMERLSLQGADLLSETLNRLDEIAPQKQENENASFAPMMKREDGLIDWTLSSSEIDCRVRGFQPWPNAYTFYQGKKLVIWKALADSFQKQNEHSPGEVIETSGNRLVIKCKGDSVLLLEEVQIEGKRRMSAKDFINGSRITIGEKLG